MRELLAVVGVGRCVMSAKAMTEALERSRVTVSARVNRGAIKMAGKKTFEKQVIGVGRRTAWREP